MILSYTLNDPLGDVPICYGSLPWDAWHAAESKYSKMFKRLKANAHSFSARPLGVCVPVLKIKFNQTKNQTISR